MAEGRTATTPVCRLAGAPDGPTRSCGGRGGSPERVIGIADEYGTIWSGEPGVSERIGDLVQRGDSETFEVRLTGTVRVRDFDHEASCAIFSGGASCSCGAVHLQKVAQS